MEPVGAFYFFLRSALRLAASRRLVVESPSGSGLSSVVGGSATAAAEAPGPAGSPLVGWLGWEQFRGRLGWRAWLLAPECLPRFVALGQK